MISSATTLYKQKFRGDDVEVPRTPREPSMGDYGKSPMSSPTRTPRATPLKPPSYPTSPIYTRNDSPTKDEPLPLSGDRDRFRVSQPAVSGITFEEAEAWGAEQARTAEEQLEQMKREMRKQQAQLQEQIEKNEERDSKISIIDAKLNDILRVLNTWPVSLSQSDSAERLRGVVTKWYLSLMHSLQKSRSSHGRSLQGLLSCWRSWLALANVTLNPVRICWQRAGCGKGKREDAGRKRTCPCHGTRTR